MEAMTLQSPLNATRITFATKKGEQEREEYLEYLQQKLDNAANEFWDSQKLDNTKMEELMYGHLRSSKK